MLEKEGQLKLFSSILILLTFPELLNAANQQTPITTGVNAGINNLFKTIIPLIILILIFKLVIEGIFSKKRKKRNEERIIIEHHHHRETRFIPAAYKRKEKFLSNFEKNFYDALTDAIQYPHYQILCMVRLADLFDIIDYENKDLYFKEIKAKHIDFIIYNPSNNKALLAIELDDSSHLREDRIESDKLKNKLFEYTKFPLLREQIKPSYNIQELRNKINTAIIHQ